jgi:predicted nucleic acid-binding protein
MIVVDTNVVAYLLIQGEKTSLAQQVYARDREWIVPALWQHEFLNVLASFVRSGGGDSATAANAWQEAVGLLGARQWDIAFMDALTVAVEHDISAYDAQFVVLAQSAAAPLISEDGRLQKRFPQIVQSMQAFLRE